MEEAKLLKASKVSVKMCYNLSIKKENGETWKLYACQLLQKITESKQSKSEKVQNSMQ